MFTLAVLVTAVLLIAPGFLAGAAFSFVLGYRSRDFNTSVVWSLVWSLLGYGIVALLHHFPVFHGWHAPEALFNLPLDGTLTPGTQKTPLNLGVVGELALAGGLCSTVLSLLVAWGLRTRPVRGIVKRLLGRPITPDVWNEYFENRAPGLAGKAVNVNVLLEDGTLYIGILENPSDIQNARGLILRDVAILPRPQGEGNVLDSAAPTGPVRETDLSKRTALSLGKPEDKLLLMGNIVFVQITNPEEAVDEAVTQSRNRSDEEELISAATPQN